MEAADAALDADFEAELAEAERDPEADDALLEAERLRLLALAS